MHKVYYAEWGAILLKIKRFIYNGVLLTAVALIIRTVSVSFNVYITDKIGAESTGLYQLVMSVYAPALTLATAGVSLSSSRLVAEELGKRRGGRWLSVYLRCLLYAFLSSAPVSLILYVISPYIASSWLGNENGSSLLQVLSIGLPFIALSSCTNGFFTALRKASKSAFLMLIEQLFRIFLTLFLITKDDLSGIKCLSAVVIGSVCSDIFSFFISVLLSRSVIKKMKKQSCKSKESITPRILSVTLPVSISSFLRSSLIALEHIMIPKGLKKNGMSYNTAMASYGTLTGMAMPIIMFPSSFLYSFSSLIIPELAEANEKKDYEGIRTNIKRILYAFLIFSVGASGIIFGFSSELGKVIYDSASVGKFLLILSPLIPFMYLDTAVDSMLKGIGEQIYTMKVNVIDAAASVISVMILVPKMGITGYVVVILISELINFSFSISRLIKITGVRFEITKKLPPILLSIITSVLTTRLIAYVLHPYYLKLVVSIPLCIVIYLIFLVIFGSINSRGKVILHKGAKYNGTKECL